MSALPERQVESVSADSRLVEFIEVYRGAFTPELCDDIVHTLSSMNGWQKAKLANQKAESEHEDYRVCEEIFISPSDTLSIKIFDSLTPVVVDYSKIHKGSGQGIKYVSGVSYLRYHEGDHYSQHSDAGDGYSRNITTSLILNDDYDGGQLAFYDQEIVLDLKKGDVVVFPSSFMFPHSVMPIKKGTRYSVVTWFA